MPRTGDRWRPTTDRLPVIIQLMRCGSNGRVVQLLNNSKFRIGLVMKGIWQTPCFSPDGETSRQRTAGATPRHEQDLTRLATESDACHPEQPAAPLDLAELAMHGTEGWCGMLLI